MRIIEIKKFRKFLFLLNLFLTFIAVGLLIKNSTFADYDTDSKFIDTDKSTELDNLILDDFLVDDFNKEDFFVCENDFSDSVSSEKCCEKDKKADVVNFIWYITERDVFKFKVYVVKDCFPDYARDKLSEIFDSSNSKVKIFNISNSETEIELPLEVKDD